MDGLAKQIVITEKTSQEKDIRDNLSLTRTAIVLMPRGATGL